MGGMSSVSPYPPYSWHGGDSNFGEIMYSSWTHECDKRYGASFLLTTFLSSLLTWSRRWKTSTMPIACHCTWMIPVYQGLDYFMGIHAKLYGRFWDIKCSECWALRNQAKLLKKSLTDEEPSRCQDQTKVNGIPQDPLQMEWWRD